MFMNPITVWAFADELVKTADLSPELIGLLLGGAGGAGAGYKLTDDPRKKARNALLGGLAGAGGGALLGHEVGSPVEATRGVPDVMGGLKPSNASNVEKAFRELMRSGNLTPRSAVEEAVARAGFPRSV